MTDERFATVKSEGGLLPVDLLERVAGFERDLPGLRPEEYHLAPGEHITEAVSDSWNRLLGVWEGFAEALENLPNGDSATGLTRQRWALILFQELGFGQLQPTRSEDVDGKTYPISHRWEQVPIHLLGARLDLDKRTPGAVGAARASPHGLLQEYLNRSDSLWGVVSNGLRLRILRDNSSLTRQAYLEFDLEAMFSGQVYSDFVVLWLVAHQSRFEGDPPETCILEQWMAEAAERGTRALDQLRDGVEAAITTLGSGFLSHPANRELRESLRSGQLSTDDYYRQLLRLVYRLIFLLVAEGRDLLLDPHADPIAAQRYRAYYSISRIRQLAEIRRGSAHTDVWGVLRIVFDALGRPSGAPELAISPLGSFLWSKQACPELRLSQLANQHLLGAIRELTSIREGKVRRSVDYRNLGPEELGSIYESLLELHPVLNSEAGSFKLTTAAGHERKSTGSYYTPDFLVSELLDTALEPVLDEAMRSDNPEEALLDVTVLDPASGSGHFLIAAAHRIARRLAMVRSAEAEPAPTEVRAALRDVIGRCLHGIDVNPMAVELCKVSLWMEAMDPGKPLSFLEHRIVCGNSLLGTTPRLLEEGLPDGAFSTLVGDEPEHVAALRKRNREERRKRLRALALGETVASLAQALARQVQTIDSLPDSDVDAVSEKERRWQDLQQSSEAQQANLMANAWSASFMTNKRPGEPEITEAIVRMVGTDISQVDPRVIDRVVELEEEYRFLHLHLAFPDVFHVPEDPEDAENGHTGWSGGFSVVLGNPPWERVKLQEKEWFAGRAPDIAGAPNAAARRRRIAALEESDPRLFTAYRRDLQKAEAASNYLRTSGMYPLCGRGDINTYTVFAELMRNGISPSGRVGVVVKTGIATDDTTKYFFGDLIEKRSLVSLFDFENKGIFPDVHNSEKFCLLTLTGSDRPSGEAEFVFFAHKPSDLADQERRFTLTHEDFALLNPNSRTCPIFRTRRDADITKAVYRRVPVLINEGPPEENPWGIRLSTMFHMTNDSHLFRDRDDLEADSGELVGNWFVNGEEKWLPTYEGKMVSSFDHRDAHIVLNPENPSRPQQRNPIPAADHTDPTVVAMPYLWCPEKEVVARCGSSDGLPPGWVGFKRVTASTNWRTMVGCVVPPSALSYTLYRVSSHTPADEACLLAGLQSFAFDYVVRQKTSQPSLPIGVIEESAFPAPPQLEETLRAIGESRSWILDRVVELSYTAWDLQAWAESLGYAGPPFLWDEDRRSHLRAELDALFFHVFGLSREDSEHILNTFPIVKEDELNRFGEYRTSRLVMDRFDAMAKAIEGGEEYESVLDPPPADPSMGHSPRGERRA